MEQAEYEKYLNRLKQLVYVELVTKVATFDYFSEHTKKYGDDPVSVEPILWPIISGLNYDVTFSLHRLVFNNGNGDRNIIHFLNISYDNFQRLSWKGQISKKDIDSLRLEWAQKSEAITRLTTRRNGFFAHYDKAHFYDPDVSLKNFPFSMEDAKDLTRHLQKTVSFFCSHVFGPRPISMDGFVYAAAESLYETMRSVSREAARKRAALKS